MEKCEILGAIYDHLQQLLTTKKLRQITLLHVMGPVAPSNNAQRFKIELAANANNARNVSIYNRII